MITIISLVDGNISCTQHNCIDSQQVKPSLHLLKLLELLKEDRKCYWMGEFTIKHDSNHSSPSLV